MSHYKPYPKYKNSGVEWLGEVPEGWKTEKISRYFGAKKGINAQQLTKEYCSTIEGSFPVYSGQTENNGVMAYIDRYEFDVGEEGVLFSTTVGAKAMNIMHLKGKFSLSQNCMIILPMKNQLLPRFFFYHFQPLFTYERQFLSEHMQASFRVDDLLQFEFTIPPLEEQSSIASFLDRETTKIDSLITKQNRLIDLLQEKRSALISHAVTKGLDPNVKMKDSGVEWLGEVPEQWVVKRLKHIADVRLSNVDKHTVEGQKVVRLCNYLDVYNNGRITSKIDFMTATASDEQVTRLSVRKDDIIITKDSEDPSDIGIPALVVEDIFGLVCGYHLAILRPTTINGEFLHSLLQSIFVRSSFEVEATGMTRYALGKYSIENLIFAVPPLTEQTTIASFLDRETAKIDSLITKAHWAIKLLQEHRSSLISAAVTGKIDVREAVSSIPMEMGDLL